MRRTKHIWTESEEEYILANYRDMSLMDMGVHLDVCGTTVRAKMISMGLETVHGRNNRKVWTEEELSFLKENFAMMSAADLADRFGVSCTTVSKKARELGLKKSPEWNKGLYNNRYVSSYSGK